MIRRNFYPHSCELDENGPESIHRAVSTAQLFSTTNALTSQQQARLAILTEEAVTNLYDHGGAVAGFAGTLTLTSDGDSVHVVLSDSGEPFDPRNHDEVEMPNAERGGGVGLAMIRAWAEIVDYRTENGINRLDLKLRD